MTTVIVAGITRSGLTATMHMLHAGGFPCFGTFPAFEDYRMGAIDWRETEGMAVKLVDTQLQFPPIGEYKVIRLRRDMNQQCRSINKWTEMLNGLPPLPIEKLKRTLVRDYAKIDEWARMQRRVVTLDFEDIILNPHVAARKINDVLGLGIDVDSAAGAVVKRDASCYQGLMELMWE